MTSAEASLEKLRAQCLKRGVAGILDFGRTFRVWDDNNDRSLNFEEFDKGVTESGAKLSADEAKELFSSFDKDGAGSIDFDELLIAIRPPMNQKRLDMVEAAFKKMDKSGDGFITVVDLKGTYDVRNHRKFLNGEKTEEQILAKLVNVFEPPDHSDDKVTLEEFKHYYSGLSASIDTDAYFVLMMKQAWKL